MRKVKTKKGKTFTLLNPAEKGRKAAYELKYGANAFTGEALNKSQRSYRSGYLAARSDNAKAYKWNLKHRKRIPQNVFKD